MRSPHQNTEARLSHPPREPDYRIHSPPQGGAHQASLMEYRAQKGRATAYPFWGIAGLNTPVRYSEAGKPVAMKVHDDIVCTQLHYIGALVQTAVRTS